MTGNELKTMDSGETLIINGVSYNLSINFNVICDLEDHYGSFKKAGEALFGEKMKDIRFLLFTILKEDNEKLTEKEVGKILTLQNMKSVMDVMGHAMIGAFPEATQGNAKNAESPQEI